MKAIITLVLCTMLISCNQQKKADIVVTIKPIQMLVAAIAGGHLESVQLIPDGVSPHHYALKPSDIKKLHNARLVFRIDEGLESFLNKTLQKTSETTHVISLADAKGVKLLTLDPKLIHQQHKHHSHQHDLHIWLDPNNAIAMAKQIEEKLSQLDPSHKQNYKNNAQQLIRKIQDTDQILKKRLKPVANKHVMVFHNAWGYFEKHYGLTSVTVINQSPTKQLGAITIRAIKQTIQTKNIACLFSEPQVQRPILQTLVQDSDVKLTELDVLGSHLKITPDSYINLLNYTANKFITCDHESN